MKFATAIIALIAGAEAITLGTNSELRSQFGFGNIFDQGASTFSAIAGDNDIAQQIQQVSNVAQGGDLSNLIGTAAMAGVPVEQIGNVINQAENGNIAGTVGTATLATGNMAGGVDGQQLTGVGNTINQVEQQVQGGNTVGAMSTTANQLDTLACGTPQGINQINATMPAAPAVAITEATGVQQQADQAVTEVASTAQAEQAPEAQAAVEPEVQKQTVPEAEPKKEGASGVMKKVDEAIQGIESDIGDISKLSGEQKDKITLQYVGAITNVQKK